ncbi:MULTISPECIES: phosphopantetheine-binding protein [unclassified Saccharibacter]|uniref:phosphopantetheine-binding protein n=1 Tax=unclassified Saccharibacter TaxID=2648722 RepID=UPI001325BFE5|nr:acyl carrier protein [Saccharibacter sp. EH611]MXV58630.1 acyl carrier protein [Saccharibacter sp. EH70]MXV66136.1 acyl carrier protein [Saccharibacter sp. EH60]
MTTSSSSPQQSPFEGELAVHLVDAVQLDMDPQEIDPTRPLFGEGLRLDFIDVLEIALMVNTQYGIKLASHDENNREIFYSLRSLAQYIEAHRPAR